MSQGSSATGPGDVGGAETPADAATAPNDSQSHPAAAADTEPPASEPPHPHPATPLPEAPEKKRVSETALRLVTAGWLVPLVLYAIITGGLVYLAVVTAFLLLGLREFYLLIEQKGARPLWGLVIAAGGALPAVA